MSEPGRLADIEMISLPEVAVRLGVDVPSVHTLVRDGKLIALRRGEEPRSVPAAFIDGADVVKSLPSVIALLRDAGFSDEEIVGWLFRPDDSLGRPGVPSSTPIDELRTNRGTEIKRRAQAAGF